MKVTAISIVLNEEEFVRYALRSVYDAVDRICLVHGAAPDRTIPGTITQDGFSVDETEKEIQYFLEWEDTKKKVTYKRVGWVETKNDLRQISLSMVDPDTDYVFVLDGDSVYDTAQLQQCFMQLEACPWIGCVLAEHQMFWRDFKTLLCVPEDRRYETHYWTPWLLWKYKPTLNYRNQCLYDGDRPVWSTIKVLSFENALGKEHSVEVMPDIPLFDWYHLGWARRFERLEEHLLCSLWSWARKWTSVPDERWEHVDKEKAKLWFLRNKGLRYVRRWARINHKLFTGVYDKRYDEHEEVYEGNYPSVMSEHPYIEYGKDALDWPNNLITSLGDEPSWLKEAEKVGLA